MIRIELSVADAQMLLALLRTTDTYPDVVEELEAALEQHGERE